MDKLLFRRILVAVLTVLAVVYVVYLLVSSNFEMYVTENAVEETVIDTIHSDGFIIRDETVIDIPSTGVLSYSLSNGEAVKAGGEIAKIYSNESDASARTKADKLEETMNSLQEIQDSYESNAIGIDTISNDINNGVITFYKDVNENDIKMLGDDISSLVSSINLRQVYTGKVADFSDEIASLQSQITQLRESSGSSTGSITSSKAGYFSSYCDGYENAIKYSDIERITLDDLENVQKTLDGDNSAGKVISGLKWYIACKVTADEMTRLSIFDGDATVLFSNISSETIPASIVRLYQEDNNSDGLLILSCNYMNSELIETRQEPIEIGLGTYTGLRISKRAIHDDYVTKTTYDDNNNKQTETEKVQGVYVLYGDEVHFKQISILYADEDYVICDENPDSDLLFNGETVSMYDKIIVEGNDIYDGKIVK